MTPTQLYKILEIIDQAIWDARDWHGHANTGTPEQGKHPEAIKAANQIAALFYPSPTVS